MAFQASTGQLAPVVTAPSPARHSLPCPESRLRDQPARGRTMGEPVPPGGFGRAERPCLSWSTRKGRVSGHGNRRFPHARPSASRGEGVSPPFLRLRLRAGRVIPLPFAPTDNLARVPLLPSPGGSPAREAPLRGPHLPDRPDYSAPDRNGASPRRRPDMAHYQCQSCGEIEGS